MRVGSIHSTKGRTTTEDADPDAWLDDPAGHPSLLRAVHTSRRTPSAHRVVTHADPGAEHILELDARLTGIIDWSDAAITCTARTT